MPFRAISADRFSAELHKVLPVSVGGLNHSTVNLRAECSGMDPGQQAGWGGATWVSCAPHLSGIPWMRHSSLAHITRLSEPFSSLDKLISCKQILRLVIHPFICRASA